MWRLKNDDSEPIIKAETHIKSAHGGLFLQLPKTAIILFMSKGIKYLSENYSAKKLDQPFPRFLNRCPIWELGEYEACFLDGGRGAPQACDTVETLAALGVKNIITVGMFGAFDPRIRTGEIITPNMAFVEEGTSLHYYTSIEYSTPNDELLELAVSGLKVEAHPIVSTDAVYRQTFLKEQLWRENGAVGVDMETSAVFSVSRYLGLNSVALLMASDIHPLTPNSQKWEWRMTDEMRFDLVEKSISICKALAR